MKVEFHLDKQSKPTSEKGVKVTYGAAKRTGYTIRWYLLLALIISPVVLMSYFFYRNYVLVIALGIVTVEPVTITATQEASVQVINVQNGHSIEQGQPLIQLDNAILNSAIEFLTQEINAIESSNKSAVKTEYKHYQRAITDASNNHTAILGIKQDYVKYKRQGQVSQVDYATILNHYDSARRAVAEERIKLNQTQLAEYENKIAGPIAQTTRSLRLQLTQKRSEREALYINSPFYGAVVDILVAPGQRIERGDEIIILAPKVPPKIVGYLDPKYLDRALQGTKVSVLFPNGDSYDATIALPTEIASKLPPQLARPFEGQPALLKVTLAFDQTPERHQWVEGMPVEILF